MCVYISERSSSTRLKLNDSTKRNAWLSLPSNQYLTKLLTLLKCTTNLPSSILDLSSMNSIPSNASSGCPMVDFILSHMS